MELSSEEYSHRTDEKKFGINTNTKARRLKFLSKIAFFCLDALDQKMLVKKLLQWAMENQDILSKHIDNKGKIDEKFGQISSSPYLNLAKKIDLIAKAGGSFIVTNHGRSLLLDPQNNEAKPSFVLTLYEKLWFLYTILSYDKNFFLPIFLFLKSGKMNKKLLREKFQEMYLAQLNLNFQHESDQAKKRNFRDLIARIQKWEKPEKYSEHFIDPRISWMIDLGLIYQNEDGNFQYSQEGFELEKRIKPFSSGNLINSWAIQIPETFFDFLAPCLIPKCEITTADSLATEALIEHLKVYFEDVLKKTKSFMRNRVVASTCFRYIGLQFFLTKNISCNYNFLIKTLSNQSFCRDLGWNFRWIKSEKDGYLIKHENQ